MQINSLKNLPQAESLEMLINCQATAVTCLHLVVTGHSAAAFGDHFENHQGRNPEGATRYVKSSMPEIIIFIISDKLYPSGVRQH